MTDISTEYGPFTHAHYRHILRSALESRYAFAGYHDVEQWRREDRTFCVMRHDCDNDLTAAARMAEIERDMGVRSTYFLMPRSAMYNLASLPMARIVDAIIQAGHWIGLHFDEGFHEARGKTSFCEAIDLERAWLSKEFGIPVNVVSIHQPSRRMLTEGVQLNCINTYDRNQMHGVHYLSDSNMIWKEGCPSTVFHEKRHRHLQLLTHPEWWTAEVMPIADKWHQMIQNNFDVVQNHLLERERAFGTRRTLDLTRSDGYIL